MKKWTMAMLTCASAVACTQPTMTPPSGHDAPPPPVPAPFPIHVPDDGGVEVAGDLLAPMPTAVTSFGAARSGEHLYVLGGYHGVPHQYQKEGQSRGLWRLRVDGEGAWEQVGELESGLQGLSLVAHGGEVCRVGGNRILNAAGEEARMLSVAEVACFDTARRTWRDLPPLPSGRSSHEAAVIGDTLYVAGGWRLGDETSGGSAKTATWHEDVVALDLNAPRAAWRSIPAPFKRRAVGVAALGDRLVVLGGLTPERAASQAVSILDPHTGTWSQGPDYPADAFGVAATAMNGKLYASARDGVIHALEEGSWARVGTLAFPRFFHQLVPAGDALVVVGGITGMQSIGRTRHTERVPLAKKTSVQHFTMPWPGKAKNRQGVFSANDSLYLFGGNNSLGQHDFAPENFVDEGWRLHLPSLGAQAVAAYPRRRQTMQTAASDALGISVGGFGHPDTRAAETAAVSHLEAFAFDFDKETWRPWGGLPRGRTQFGLTEHDGQLWVFGGLDYDPARKGPEAFEHVTTTLLAPLAGDGAFTQSDVELPGPRRAFGGAALGEHYYLVGGMKESFQLVDGCLRFDFHDKSFDAFPCPAHNRLSAELVALEGKLYIVGGSIRVDGKMTSDRSVEVFDPATKTWSVLLDDIGFDTKHARALAYRDRLLVVSTHMTESRVRVVLIKP